MFFVDEGIDSGPIIVQKNISIGNMTEQELIVKTKNGMDAISKSAELIQKGNVRLINNDDSKHIINFQHVKM